MGSQITNYNNVTDYKDKENYKDKERLQKKKATNMLWLDGIWPPKATEHNFLS